MHPNWRYGKGSILPFHMPVTMWRCSPFKLYADPIRWGRCFLAIPCCKVTEGVIYVQWESVSELPPPTAQERLSIVYFETYASSPYHHDVAHFVRRRSVIPQGRVMTASIQSRRFPDVIRAKLLRTLRTLLFCLPSTPTTRHASFTHQHPPERPGPFSHLLATAHCNEADLRAIPSAHVDQ